MKTQRSSCYIKEEIPKKIWCFKNMLKFRRQHSHEYGGYTCGCWTEWKCYNFTKFDAREIFGINNSSLTFTGSVVTSGERMDEDILVF